MPTDVLQTEEALKQLFLGLLRDVEFRGRVRDALTGGTVGEPVPLTDAVFGAGAALEEMEVPETPWAARSGQDARELLKERDSLKKERDDLKNKNDDLSKSNGDLRSYLFAEKSAKTKAENDLFKKKADCERLKVQLDEERTRNEDAERRVSTAKAQAQSAEAARMKAEKKVQAMESAARPFQDLMACFTSYQSYNSPALKQVLPDTDPVLFLSVGCQRETVFLLWDALRDVCEEDHPQGWETLLLTIRYLIDRYNSTKKNPVLSLMEGEKGKPFQDTRHSRSSRCSRYQGHVEQVLLPGIWNNNRNQAERKTVVYFA